MHFNVSIFWTRSESSLTLHLFAYLSRVVLLISTGPGTNKKKLYDYQQKQIKEAANSPQNGIEKEYEQISSDPPPTYTSLGTHLWWRWCDK